MAKTYTLNVAGLTRELTICKVNDHMDIAAFIMLGDAELTVAAATELLKKCPEFDILLTADEKIRAVSSGDHTGGYGADLSAA